MNNKSLQQFCENHVGLIMGIFLSIIFFQIAYFAHSKSIQAMEYGIHSAVFHAVSRITDYYYAPMIFISILIIISGSSLDLIKNKTSRALTEPIYIMFWGIFFGFLAMTIP